MQRFTWMVGALGLALVIGGSTQADPKHQGNNNQSNNRGSNNQGNNQGNSQTSGQDKHQDKQNDKQDKHQDKPVKVDPAPLNPTAGLKEGLSKKTDTPLQKLNNDKGVSKKADKKVDSKAVMDAQAAKAAADKAYVDAQNAASVARGQVGSAQAKYDQAFAKSDAASTAYAKSPTPENLAAVQSAQKAVENAGVGVGLYNASNNAAIAKVNASTAAKDKADADLKAATAGNAGGTGGSGKTSGGGTVPIITGRINNGPINQFPSGQVITSSSVPVVGMGDPTVGSTGPIPATNSIVTTTAKPVIASAADLVLEDIQLASPATLVAGPAYTVKFRNQGTDAAARFQVGVLAGIDDKLSADAPRGVVEVKSLAAGQSGEVTLRLPQAALKMDGADGRSTPFTRLFVAVDLMNTVAETDKANNTAVVERAGLETNAAH